MGPLLFAILVGILCVAPVVSMESYATKYDHIDVEMILNNRRMVNHYAACMLSKGPCPPEGLEFKRILPEALRTNCDHCTEKQKAVTLRAIRRLKKEYPKVWAQLEQQWDPERIYIKQFEDTISKLYPEATAESSLKIFNKFGAAEHNSINSVYSTSVNEGSSPLVLSSVTTEKSLSKHSLSSSSSLSPEQSTISQSKKSIASSTLKPKSNPIKLNTNSGSTVTNFQFRPIANIGAGLEATVSLGTNIMGELVKGLGAISTRVVETGAEIADVVLKKLSEPL